MDIIGHETLEFGWDMKMGTPKMGTPSEDCYRKSAFSKKAVHY